MYMWNIKTDSYQAVMAGKNWVATPMCLNYGYFNHGYQDKYTSYIYDDVYKKFFYFNNFGKEKTEFIEDIKKWASPSTYVVSINLGDVSKIFSDIETWHYNVAHVLLSDEQIKIAIAWLHNNNKPKLIDYKLVYVADIEASDILLEHLYSTRSDKIIMTFCIKVFKNTLKMYGSNCILRFMADSMSKCVETGNSQCVGYLRIDSGKDKDTNTLRKFSVIKSMEYPESDVDNHIHLVDLSKFVK